MPASRLWQPVLATPAHLPGLCALYETVWGVKVAPEALRWKLFDGPFGPLASVAMVGEACVGLYAVIPTPLLLDGAPILGAQSVDTMTHPDYRRQNMSVTLARHCYAEAARRGYGLVYGLPNENSYPMFMTKLDWRHLDEMARMVRPLAAPRRVPGVLAPLLDAVMAAQVRLSGGAGQGVLDKVTPATRFAVPARVPSGARCRVNHTPDWLAWRYGAEPGGAYERLVLGPPEAPQALAIFDMAADDNDPGGRALLRIDALIGAPDARLAAARALLRLGVARGARSAFFFTSDAETQALLRRAGFVPRSSMPLCFGALALDMAGLPSAKGEMAIEGGDRD
ncbi:GNAT family N-acetyltransferase [Azorhizobium doebereinerae]|uniref:GNAT family N-acetyltransferase n=1 Tax=Azorhizobium doebereinerae TaxID=281091 RepID=UPI0004123F47|nr:GNAT family N-acetyltransferase [Azorhizobium doebereinerae]